MFPVTNPVPSSCLCMPPNIHQSHVHSYRSFNTGVIFGYISAILFLICAAIAFALPDLMQYSAQSSYGYNGTDDVITVETTYKHGIYYDCIDKSYMVSIYGEAPTQFASYSSCQSIYLQTPNITRYFYSDVSSPPLEEYYSYEYSGQGGLFAAQYFAIYSGITALLYILYSSVMLYRISHPKLDEDPRCCFRRTFHRAKIAITVVSVIGFTLISLVFILNNSLITLETDDPDFAGAIIARRVGISNILLGFAVCFSFLTLVIFVLATGAVKDNPPSFYINSYRQVTTTTPFLPHFSNSSIQMPPPTNSIQMPPPQHIPYYLPQPNPYH